MLLKKQCVDMYLNNAACITLKWKTALLAFLG